MEPADAFDYLGMFARFPFALHRFLDCRLTVEQARQIVRERMARREENLLRMVERSIYANPRSPYLRLLEMAGCGLGDLHELVRQRGVEGALRQLREAGVYVTFEEFKGRQPIVRNRVTLPVSPRDFDNPLSRRDFAIHTSGSTGLASNVNQDLDYIAAGVAHHLLWLAAYDLLNVPTASWMNMLPGNALRFILQRACLGQATQTWFSRSGWRDSRSWIAYDLATLYIVFWMRAFRTGLPLPRIVRPEQALTVARWVQETLHAYPRCLLYTGVSHALRIGVAAREAGIDLAGAAIRVGGEPITAAKVQGIESAGIRSIAAYGAVETGTLGIGCLNRTQPDDMHFFHDHFALFTYPHLIPSAGITVPAFNLTSLSVASTKVMLNYQLDDCGVLEDRECGCPLGAQGYVTHLHNVRSYGKFVGESVTLIGNEVLRVVEQILPAQFGGSPLDYQLMEEEEPDGVTRVCLIISPRVDIPDEREVVEVFLRALGESSPTGDATRAVWLHAHTLVVKRMEPLTTASGKLPTLYVQPPLPQS